jgi:FtsP/CotA-like multicopper oxidase with cupredoxin domain
MRGMFIALMVMGAIWTGGLVWSLFGGLVLVPQTAVAVGGVKTAAAPAVAAPPAQAAAAQAQAKATTAATASKPAGQAMEGHSPDAHAASHAAQLATASRGNQLLAPKPVDGVKVFELTAQVVRWEVAPGELVEAYAYNGTVPGPLLRVTEGDRVRIVLKNELPEPTVLHLHGPRLPNSQDGVPDVTQPLVKPGESYTYELEVHPAGTFMYHTHHNSAVQEAKGLYGILQIDPQGYPPTYDREYFQILSELAGFYVINGKAFPSTEPIEAKVGETVRIHLVNLGQMVHPMHSHGYATKIVATDGYPVEGPVLTKDTVSIGPGERYDLEFVADNPGAWVYHCHILSHVQNKGVEPGGMISVIKVTE